MMSALDGWGSTVRMQSDLRHPNVLALLSTVFEINLIAAIYEGAIEGTMGELMRGKHLKWKDTSMLGVAEGVVEGMIHIQDNGVPHGFLNPENVVFGMGRGVKVRGAYSADAWTTGYIFTSHTNTLCYLSPARLRGEKATLEDDIYSFGMVMYSSVCGGDAFQTLIKVIREEQVRLERRTPGAKEGSSEAVAS
jgi:serine/threonine protein kinase